MLSLILSNNIIQLVPKSKYKVKVQYLTANPTMTSGFYNKGSYNAGDHCTLLLVILSKNIIQYFVNYKVDIKFGNTINC